jgi:hypothetical protein
MFIQCPAGRESQRETPQAQVAEKAPGPPAESEFLESKSTGKFNRAYFLSRKGPINREDF